MPTRTGWSAGAGSTVSASSSGRENGCPRSSRLDLGSGVSNSRTARRSTGLFKFQRVQSVLQTVQIVLAPRNPPVIRRGPAVPSRRGRVARAYRLVDSVTVSLPDLFRQGRDPAAGVHVVHPAVGGRYDEAPYRQYGGSTHYNQTSDVG